MVEGSSDPLRQAKKRFSLRHIAAENGHFEAAQVLIAAGARINASSKSHLSPLFVSAQRGHLKAQVALKSVRFKRQLNKGWKIKTDGMSGLEVVLLSKKKSM